MPYALGPSVSGDRTRRKAVAAGMEHVAGNSCVRFDRRRIGDEA